ncbi:hypothetical protein D092_22875 [Rhodococcus ruber Chol-4]|uniref:hypothetical protein n=1 Tax=Rhodococcus TaxID=1827 RepID=UPI000346F3B6|nr:MULTISPECIES: hypothetical protein [Rhodococcus]AUM16766.1 hypothetical protein CSW53_09590 [Rhodococcus ruber]KXF84003.1 hypothetical protein D092_22875 [Rhodococcus ruber Chol-4]MBD8054625.1 hypothetical protein [Rhodococcus ruber]MCF8785895.1 hypothetical protein [Rhodococcus ruber]
MRFGYAGATAAVLSTIVTAVVVPATAQATATADVVAGRERVKVTVHGVPVHPESCRVDPDADGNTRSLPLEPSGSMVAHQVAPGPRRVVVWCPDGGVVHQQIVHVLPADPLADLADHAFRTAGSSDRVTDPTLR